MRLFILTTGTRGDIQPFVALGKGLQKSGHDVTLCTHSTFKPFIASHGLNYAYLNDDLIDFASGSAGREAIEGGNGPMSMIKRVSDASRAFKPIFTRLLREEWDAAQGADAIIYHPQAVGGYSIAEALRVPGIMADPLPTWVPTGEFPNLALPNLKLGKGYNRWTYKMLPSLTRSMYGSVVRAWRVNTLKLPARPTHGSELIAPDGTPVLALHAFSANVVARPKDWPDRAHVTGYWFLDEPDWQAPAELEAFLAKGSPPVAITFGSMSGRNPARTTRTILEALTLTKQRGLLVTGWGGLATEHLPDSVFKLEGAPYDWLFPRVSLVVHHGGAGTAAAALKAGKPSVVCPFVGDQPFWGKRIAALGVGPKPIPQRRLTADRLAAAIKETLKNAAIQKCAFALGKKIQAENGIQTAIALIDKHLSQRT